MLYLHCCFHKVHTCMGFVRHLVELDSVGMGRKALGETGHLHE